MGPKGTCNSKGEIENPEGKIIKLITNKIGRKNDQNKMHSFHVRMFGTCRKLYKVVQFGTRKPQETKSTYSSYKLLRMLTGSLAELVSRKENPASK